MNTTTNSNNGGAVEKSGQNGAMALQIDAQFLIEGKNGKPCGVVNRKAFGEAMGLSGAELKRQHNKLVVEFNRIHKPAALAALGQDGVVIKRFETSHGTAGTFITVKALFPAKPLVTDGGRAKPALSVAQQIAAMSQADRDALIAQLVQK